MYETLYFTIHIANIHYQFAYHPTIDLWCPLDATKTTSYVALYMQLKTTNAAMPHASMPLCPCALVPL